MQLHIFKDLGNSNQFSENESAGMDGNLSMYEWYLQIYPH